MRHNPASGAIVIMLRQLKMHGMAQAVGELTEQGSPAFEVAIPILSQLLKAETAEREARSTAYQLKTARFPAYRDLNGFDFTSSEINEALVRQLHRCDFLNDANNIVLVDGPGTGKTHIATAIGVQAIEHHHKRGSVLLDRRAGQRLGTGEGARALRADCQSACPLRSRHPRRARILAVQRARRCDAVPSAEQALRAHQRHHHDKPQLQRMGLLGQAEHGYNSPAVLITNSRKLADATLGEIERLLAILPTADTARRSWEDYGEVIVCDTHEEMLDVANDIASEHVQV